MTAPPLPPIMIETSSLRGLLGRARAKGAGIQGYDQVRTNRVDHQFACERTLHKERRWKLSSLNHFVIKAKLVTQMKLIGCSRLNC
jgi:hypothetical protein